MWCVDHLKIIMKYLKDLISWKTSKYHSITDIRNNCIDILLELSDKRFEYTIYGTVGGSDGPNSKDSIRIEIGDENKIIKLKEFELEFEHLLSYLKEEGVILSSNQSNTQLGWNSYYQNNNWEYYECCPKCNSNDVSPPDDLQSLTGWKCNKCKHIGHQDSFQKTEYPITIGDLIYAIKNNYYIDFMLLNFTRDNNI